MKTIAIIGQKGGTGKTTLTEILLVEFERAGYTTAGIDLDPQTSLCVWGDAREDDSPAIIPMQHSRLTQTLKAAKEQGVDVAVIDTAGRAESAALAAAQAADVAIIPVQPTTADLTTVQNTMDLVGMGKTKHSFAVLMRVKAQGSRHTEAADALKSMGMKVCPHTIGDRVAYQDAAALGQTPSEYDMSSKSALECKQVYKFTCKTLGIKDRKK